MAQCACGCATATEIYIRRPNNHMTTATIRPDGKWICHTPDYVVLQTTEDFAMPKEGSKCSFCKTENASFVRKMFFHETFKQYAGYRYCTNCLEDFAKLDK